MSSERSGTMVACAVAAAIVATTPAVLGQCQGGSSSPAMRLTGFSIEPTCSSEVYPLSCTGLNQEVAAVTSVGDDNAIVVAVYDLDTCAGGTVSCSTTAVYCGDLATDTIGGGPALAWTGVTGVVADEEEDCDGFVSQTATARFDTPGLHTVTCTISDSGQYVDQGGVITINFDVKPDPPACPRSRGPFWGCEQLGGGCGSCEGGLPEPDLREPFIAVIPPNLGPGYDGGNAGSAGCPKDTIKLFDTCQGIFAIYHNRCGGCCQFYVGGSGSEPCGDGVITWGEQIPGGGVGVAAASIAQALVTSGEPFVFTATYPDGSYSTFELATPTVATGFMTRDQGPNTVVAADGSVTTFARDAETGAIESVTLPNGEFWEYDVEGGNITEVTRPDGTVVELEYEDGRLTSVTGPSPLEISYAYNQDGTLASATNGSRTLTYAYDTNQITVMETSADPNLVTEYDYGDEQSLSTTITRVGSVNQVTVYTFLSANGKGLLDLVTDSLDGETDYYYDEEDDLPYGRLTSVTGPDGIETAYDYNPKGAVSSVTRIGGQMSSQEQSWYRYSENDPETVWLVKHQDAEGNWTYYQRDMQSTPWQVDAIKVAPSGQEPNWANVDPVKTFEYYTADCADGRKGMLKKEIVPGVGGAVAQVTEYKYGYGVAGKWRESPTATLYQFWNGTSYEARTSTAVYDDLGRLLLSTDADGREVRYRYDALGRQTHVIYAWEDADSDEQYDPGEETVFTENHYTCCGLEWTRDENGNKTYSAYDGANRLAKIWTDISGHDVDHPLVSYTYDAFGNQQTVTTRSGASTSRVTGYDYDSANRVTKIEYPDGIVGDEEFGYDDAGSLLWKKDGNGKFTLYQYDDLRRLIAVYYLPGALPNPISYQGLTADVTYTYNGGTNQRETMADAAGTSEFDYDSQARLKTYTPPLGLDTGYYVEYAYNNAGQKTGVKIWNGTTASYDVSYEYYANGWLKAVKCEGATVASYSYDAVGNRTRVDYGNGTYATFGYESGDPRYRLQTITHKLGTTTLATFGYTRDDVGNPLSFTGLEGAWAYTYDAMNRLASATPPEVPLPGQAGGTYSYDWVGNMKAEASSNPWQFNAADQLTLWPGMQSYEYDDNGALTAVKTPDGQTEQQSFTYHPSGLMNQAMFNGQTLTNLWDADEHRVQVSIGEDEYASVFDVTAGIPAVIKEDTPQGTIYYVREPGGELICRVATVGETTHKWFYHFDELGSTRLITDDSGAVTDSYAYDAYGAVISHDRNTGTINQPCQYVGQLGYYTHYQAPAFGWLQLGVRFYQPELGRFERRDPLYRVFNSAGYVEQRPLVAADPQGLETVEQCVRRCDERFWLGIALAHLSLATAHITCLPAYAVGPEAYLSCLGGGVARYGTTILWANVVRRYCKLRCMEGSPSRCGRVWIGPYNDDDFFPKPPRRLPPGPPGYPRRER